jgi:hypothetical protein
MRPLSTKAAITIALLFTGLFVKAQTPLNGEYFIGPGRNYTNISAATEALKNYGINGQWFLK